MNVFLDANVLISVLNKEYPSYAFTARLLSLDSRRFRLFTTPLCLAIAFYFAEKKRGNKAAKAKIEILAQHLHIAENKKEDVFDVLKNRKINDFEDGLEYYAAIKSNFGFIITEDVDDFYFSEIEVMKPKEFLMTHAV